MILNPFCLSLFYLDIGFINLSLLSLQEQRDNYLII